MNAASIIIVLATLLFKVTAHQQCHVFAESCKYVRPTNMGSYQQHHPVGKIWCKFCKGEYIPQRQPLLRKNPVDFGHKYK